MKLGTWSSVVTSPLIRPMSAPTASISSITGRIRPSSSPIRLPAITTCAATTAPIERSNSPETITKYWPIAAMAIGAVRPTKRMSTPGSPKLGLADDRGHQQHDRPARRPRRRGWRAAASGPAAASRPGGRAAADGLPRAARGCSGCSSRLLEGGVEAGRAARSGPVGGRSRGGRRRRRRRRSRRPRTTSWRNGLTCMTPITLSMTAKIATPARVPTMLPLPPASRVPPRTTAAIDIRS